MHTLSIITPFYNESQNLPVFRDRVNVLLDALDLHGEIVLVDDHSNDGSPEIAREWARADGRVRYLRLSRNSGSHVAISAGLACCSGDCAVMLAADLQDPPELIQGLLKEWQAGSDVVWAVRAAREGERWSTRAAAAIYYWLMRRVALPDMPAKGADFLLMDRKVIDAYNAIGEKNTSVLGMILWMGFRQTFIPYVKQSRHRGHSKWTLAKKLKLFVDSVVSFSYVPVRAMSLFGVVLATAGFLYALVVVVGRFGGWISTGSGFAALMTVLLVGQGVIMSMLGILGEYVWRTYDEARSRPRYIIEEQVGASSEAEVAPLPSARRRAA